MATWDEKEKWFKERTDKHVAEVQKYAKILADATPGDFEPEELMASVAKHDELKYQDPEYKPYVELTWQHKQDGYDGYKNPGEITKEEINQATLHHVRNSSHHPEFWLKDKDDANIDPNDRDKSVKVVMCFLAARRLLSLAQLR